MHTIERLYTGIGGRFVTKPETIAERLKNVKAFVFDWDGVFNNGQKMAGTGSAFSEVDSMGTNLLRFSYHLLHGKHPICALISGEKNEPAFYFSERECFQYSFYKVAHKAQALATLCEKAGITPSEVAYFFDDVLDLPIAEQCGIRILVNQKINPLFQQYCIQHHMADYICAASGGQFAVREASELLIGLNENYDQVISERKNNSSNYQKYITERRTLKPTFFTLTESGIVEMPRPA